MQFLALMPFSLSSFLGTGFGDLVSPIPSEQVLSVREMSLENRWPNSFVNNVFKDNILLNLAYFAGTPVSSKPNWDEVKKSSSFEFRLDPQQTFAFHDDVLAKYKGKVTKTTNAHFNSYEGFKTDGYLFGDGVCHLASLIYWAAKEAGLEAEAPTAHDFAKINDIPKEFGVSIYNNPYTKGSNAQQNLYVTNNKNKPIAFKFEYSDNKVKVSVSEMN